MLVAHFVPSFSLEKLPESLYSDFELQLCSLVDRWLAPVLRPQVDFVLRLKEHLT